MTLEPAVTNLQLTDSLYMYNHKFGTTVKGRRVTTDVLLVIFYYSVGVICQEQWEEILQVLTWFIYKAFTFNSIVIFR